MKIFLTGELTQDMFDKLNDVMNEINEELVFFESKCYGKYVNEIYIGLFCMDDKMTAFFKPRRPIYRQDAKEYIHRGIAVSTIPGTLIYELRLDYLKYKQGDNVRCMLLADIFKSLQIIGKQKEIAGFDLARFSTDFKQKFGVIEDA